MQSEGAISFGLVNIPINLLSAVRDYRPHFRLLHAKDKSRCVFSASAVKKSGR